MATATAFIQKSPDQGSPFTGYIAGQATIDSGETATLSIPCGGRSVVRLGVPTIDTGTLTFTVVPYKGATARALEDTAGAAVAVASSTGGFSVTIPELSGCYSFTIIAASQTSDRVIDVQCVGTEPSRG
jgi:hypothetical protein